MLFRISTLILAVFLSLRLAGQTNREQEYFRANQFQEKADSLLSSNSLLDSAEKLFDSAIFIYRKQADQVNYLKCQNGKSQILWRTGRLQEALGLAIEVYNQYNELPTEAKEPYFLSSICQNLGVINDISGDFNQAIQWHKNAEKNLLLSDHNEWQAYNQLYRYLSIAYKNAGLFASALEYGEKALRLIEKNAPQSSYELAVAYNNVGIPHWEIGQAQLAIKNFDLAIEQLLPIEEERFGLLILTYNNKALVYQDLQEYDSALSNYKKGLALYDHYSDGSKSYSLALLFVNMGGVLAKIGQYDSALVYCTEGMKIATEIRSGSRFEAISRDMLSRIHYQRGNLDSSRYYLGLSEQFYESKNTGKRNLYYYRHLYLRILNQFKDGDTKQASDEFYKLSKKYLEYLHYSFDQLSEYERERLHEKVKQNTEIYKNFAARFDRKYGNLMNIMMASKSLLLQANQLQRDRIYASQDRILIEGYNELQELKQQFGKKLSSNDQESSADSLLEVIIEKDRELTQMSKFYAQQAVPPTWQSLQELLQENEAAVKIITIQDYDFDKLRFGENTRYYALVLRKDMRLGPELIPFPGEGIIDERSVRVYQNAVRYQMDDTDSYKQFWGFLDPLLTDIDKIYLSVDGVLNNVNFATLYDSKTEMFLIEKLEVHRVMNFSSHVSSSKGSATPIKYAVLLGNPDFQNEEMSMQEDLSKDTIKYRGFSAVNLPGTEEELKQLELLLSLNDWRTDKYEKEEASEYNLKNIRRPGLLHIATHGFFLPERKYQTSFQVELFNSGLLLSDYEETDSIEIFGMESGPGEDGVLTSFEAIDLNIADTELVVLSACETGLGTVHNGEGVYGLQRAILAAGAKSLMMSLWKIDDKVTKEMMLEFYQQWLGGEPKRSSLRQVQLDMIKQKLHPYYWGPFVIIGE